MRTLRTTYGRTPANDFGPLALQAIQRQLVESGKSRPYVDYLVGAIKRVFEWGVSQEVVSESTYRALTTVAGLRKDHTPAPEPKPVRPVADEVVQATLPHLPEVVADMVRLQRLTGCRPAESYCFSPIDSERRRLADRREKRRTPLSCGNRPGTNRKRRPKRKPRHRYDTNSYRRAIHRAVELANRTREQDDQLPRWSPNRLRHSAATEIRKRFGLEAAQVTKPSAGCPTACCGEEGLKTRFADLGCDMGTFSYQKLTNMEDGVPAVIETAFAWRGDNCEDERRLVTGVNWSPGIGNPFRELGGGYRDGLTALLEKQRAGAEEPVVFLLHLACPRVRYTDRGKSAIAID